MTDLQNLQRTIKEVTIPYSVMVGGGIVKSHEHVLRLCKTEVLAEWGSITSEPKTGNGGRDYYAHYDTVSGRLVFALNSIGLTNPGMSYVEKHAKEALSRYQDQGKPLPINVSGEGVDDTISLIKRAVACGFPIITVNAACPNKVGKDSKPMPIMCYDMDSMSELMMRADKEVGRTKSVIMLKVSTGMPLPTLANICILLKVSATFDGIITGNTVPNGFALLPDGEPAIKTEKGITVGGMSGPAIKPLSLNQTRFAADILGDKKVVWGCGGAGSAEDAREFFQLGAQVVQVVTAFRENHEHPNFIVRILEDLID